MEADNTRTVEAVLSTVPMYFYDKTQTQRKLGDVVIERYDKGAVATYTYRPYGSNGMTDYKRSRDQYALGVGTGKINAVNPADVQAILIDMGWQTVDYKFARGGACLTAIMTRQDGMWEDTIQYDGHLWKGRKAGGIFPALMAEFNLQISNMAVSLSEGIFRTVCINGMFVRVFELGRLNIRHLRNDILENLDEHLRGVLVNPTELPGGRKVMSKTNLAQIIYYLTRNYERLLEGGSRYIKKDQIDLSQLTPFRPQVMPKSVFYGFKESLTAILDKREDAVTPLDLINAYTSGINLSELAGSREWSLFHAADQVVDSLIQIGKFGDFFDGTFQMTAPKPDYPEPLPVPVGPEPEEGDVPLDQDVWNLQDYLKGF